MPIPPDYGDAIREVLATETHPRWFSCDGCGVEARGAHFPGGWLVFPSGWLVFVYDGWIDLACSPECANRIRPE